MKEAEDDGFPRICFSIPHVIFNAYLQRKALEFEAESESESELL